jgi:23S rRNA-/tRNA-specific pseudouridylate synthase
LSLSLALARAYHHQVDITATTLVPCQASLDETYQSPEIVQELRETYHVPVYFGVDATQLHRETEFTFNHGPFDLILFHHPHLGDLMLSNFQNESAHAHRHHVLLTHYLHAGAQCVTPNGLVHVCLCGTQADTWKLSEAAVKSNVDLVATIPVTVPLSAWPPELLDSFSLHEECSIHPEWKPPRRHRYGKQSSRHWLHKYGYRHQRTHGRQCDAWDKQVNVTGAQHYLFRPRAVVESSIAEMSHDPHDLTCTICGSSFDRTTALETHMAAPALPDPPPVREVQVSSIEQSTQKHELSNSSDHDPNCDQSMNHQSAIHDTLDVSDPQSTLTRVIDEVAHGKRLRWFLQHAMLPNSSKRTCEHLIVQGFVAINGTIVNDSSRLLQLGILVEVRMSENDKHAVQSVARVDVVAEWAMESTSPLLVVWKPVGMRTIGKFGAETLEFVVSFHRQCDYHSLTRLDTGCAGLCVLQPDDSNDSLSLAHTFTALVYGLVPKSWYQGITMDLSSHQTRQWKKTITTTTYTKESMRNETSAPSTCFLKALSHCSNGSSLSTIQITTSTTVSGIASLLCHSLRQQYGFPVVGDRFVANREYLQLPRAMRNRLKQRLCLGCTAIASDALHRTVSVPIPEKWSAAYWHDFTERKSELIPPL